MKDYAQTTAENSSNFQSAQLPTPFSPYRAFGKRVFDLLAAMFMAPILVPVIGLLILMVRRDGGPGLYSQERVGLDGKHFRCWKLRTMVVDAEKVLEELCASDEDIAREWHVNQKLENDPRITPVGKFLRATSLDELPQFFNVLMGDMSFVGPRPFMTNQEFMYKSAGGHAYFKLRPGITGPWQVSGRGETGFLDRIHFDQNYLDRHSLIYDLTLMVKTVTVVFRRTGH